MICQGLSFHISAVFMSLASLKLSEQVVYHNMALSLWQNLSEQPLYSTALSKQQKELKLYFFHGP